jgi:hypothetical protein
MPFDDFDGQQEYQKSITISTVLGGWTVRYTDKNPNYVTWMKDDTYDPKFHLQYFSRTRIFTEASKLVDWLTTRI